MKTEKIVRHLKTGKVGWLSNDIPINGKVVVYFEDDKNTATLCNLTSLEVIGFND